MNEHPHCERSCKHPLDKIKILDTPRGFRALCTVCGEKSPGKIYKQDARDVLRKRGAASGSNTLR